MSGEGLILLVDDDPGTRKVARANLGLEGFEVLLASSGAEALDLLAGTDPLAVVSDLRMPDLDGIALMAAAHARRPGLPFVLVTAHATVETAVAALRQGAVHYLTKPIRFDELALVLRHAVAGERSRRDVLRLRGELERAAGFEELVGSSPAMRQVFTMVDQVAPTDATVLLRGETGTGKELVARAIHRRSPRRDRPFVAVNCTAVPRELMESEFFGHEKGAFTGAVGRQRGKLEQADNGTLFLDELGEMALPTQSRLLRVLQERTLVRIGGSEQIPFRVRLISATKKDLQEAVGDGTFREDLYFRVVVYPIRVPPLRERKEDLPLLVHHFIRKHRTGSGASVEGFTPEALAQLERHDWPGNVRELENTIHRAIVAARGPILTAQDFPLVAGVDFPAFSPRHPQLRPEPAYAPAPQAPQRVEAATALVTLEDHERAAISRALVEVNGNVKAAADRLQVARSTLYRRIKALRIQAAG